MFLVCGEALFDFFPEATDDGGLRFDARVGGSPFNVAVGLARLDRPAALFTALSDDFLGDRLFDSLTAEGVETRYLLRKHAPTTLTLVGEGPDGAPRYAFYGRDAADRAVTVGELPVLGDRVHALHFGSYSIAVATTADALAALAARECGRRLISLDPNVRLTVEPDVAEWRRRIDTFAGLADTIKISEEDATALYPGVALADMARRWLEKSARLVVVTRGGDGAIAFTRTHSVARPGLTVPLVDTVGAGDTFQAAMLCALDQRGLVSGGGLDTLSPADIADIVDFAVRAAAITCARRGADMPRRADLDVMA